ncbi:hypothetical protein C4588_06810 [Candidatus Parcubacteria bacterium]|nr:MAG: hypothetical protein C4588_06810 [Candidatus Parcubacteria bacterium]
MDEKIRRLERAATYDTAAEQALLRLRQRSGHLPVPWIHQNCHCLPPCSFRVTVPNIKCTCGEEFEAACTLTDRQCDETCAIYQAYRNA